MKKTEYAHHVIEKYISVSAVCTFAMENYRQQTAEDANRVLREQFNTSMGEYEKIYSGMNGVFITNHLQEKLIQAFGAENVKLVEKSIEKL